MSAFYGYPDVGRFGLGHSMLAWARCQIWCNRTGAIMIAPRWLRIRVGPYLRRERDKREYFRYFRSRPNIGAPRRELLLATRRKTTAGPGLPSSPFPGITVFRNEGAPDFERHFTDFRGHAKELHAAFRQMVRPRFLPPRPRRAFVAVHVRQGDFSPFSTGAAASGKRNLRLPLNWYCSALAAIRDGAGNNTHAIVFSDGDPVAMAPLLAMGNVSLARPGSPVTQMLEMTDASAIIGAGSNFNLWPAFFSQVPRLCFPGQHIATVHDDPSRQISWEGGLMPSSFTSHIERSLEQARRD